jgi:GAF domain-containing protein
MGVFSYLRVRAARDQLLFLIQFENTVSAQPTIDATLRRIVDLAIAHSGADAGSLFVVDGDQLRFEVARNKTLEKRDGSVAAAQRRFTKFTVPISKESIAGYVAATARALNLPDAYHIPPGVPYRFNSSFDRMNDYRSQSMLVVPLTGPDGAVLGVLQLINRTADDGSIEAFPADEEAMIRAMAGRAAVALHYAAASTQPSQR